MREKLVRNIGLKLMSLIMAFLLWIVIINSQDPMETAKFENIPVKILNEDSLRAKDKIPEIVEGDTVTVVVEARRSICSELTKEDIIVTADFEKVSVTEAVPIEVSVKGYTDREVEIVRGLNQVMKLRLEDMATKDFRVKITTVGTPAEGYVVGDTVSSPNMITVSGSKTQISKIKEIVLTVDVEGISEELLTTATPVVYDMNGDVVNASKITLSMNTASVKVPLLQTRNIRLLVYTEGTVEEGYEVADISYQPQNIMIAGTAEDLQRFGYALSAYCDVTGKIGIIEENIDISSLWDSTQYPSIRLVEEEILAVTIQVNEYGEKELEILPEQVELRNRPQGMDVFVESISANRFRVKGGKVRLAITTTEKLAPYIDLSGCTEEGVYSLPLQTKEISDLHVVSELYVNVRISEQKQEEQQE